MRLSEGTINTISYFFEEKTIDRWSAWEKNKEVILEELPILKMYLEKERELEALGKAVIRELDTYICSEETFVSPYL